MAEATPKGTKKSSLAKLTKKSRWVSMKPVRRKAAGGGYVAAIDLPEAGSNRIVERAESFAGVRYRYGQMSRSGTDCSGFTSQVYRGLGVKLPRSSRDQARVGVPVTGGKMKPGDLVFFRTTRANRISHVGIYVGANKFIHASSGGGRVQVSSLNDRYYHNRFVAARRMVKTKQQANEISRVVKNEPAPRAPGRVAAATQPNNEGIDANGVIQ